MSRLIEYDGARIDETSQILLQILRDYTGEVDIRTLRQEADLSQASQIHYRYRHHLGVPHKDDVDDGAAGLVQKVGKREIGGQEMSVFELTTRGQEFIQHHEDELLDAVGAARAVESLRRMRSKLNDLEARVAKAEEKARDAEQSLSNSRTTMSRAKKKAERAENGLREKADSEDVIELVDRVNEVEQSLEAVQDWIREQDTGTLENDESFSEFKERTVRSFANVDEKLSRLHSNQQEILHALADTDAN